VAACVFCQIVARDLPARVVCDDEQTMGFLDRTPLFPGHVLLVPKVHVETLADLPDELVEPLFIRARQLSAVMESALGSTGSFVAVNNKVSQSVPHLHVHVVPRNRKDGLKGFFWPRHKYTGDAHADAVAATLRAALS
jgi:histidine triad (HIT) family protein